MILTSCPGCGTTTARVLLSHVRIGSKRYLHEVMMSNLLRSIMFTLCALALAAPSFAMSADGCGGDCASCHSLTLQEAGGILKDLGSVKQVKPAQVRGLYAVSYTHLRAH